MGKTTDYYISAVRTRGGHITHCRVHKALENGSFAPYGLVQPRSTVILNLRSRSRGYRTLNVREGRRLPGDPVRLAEVEHRYYLRRDHTDQPGDDLGDLPRF